VFTGIIETTGIIRSAAQQGNNLDFWIEAPITPELKIDQSVAHNGVCLTVVAIEGQAYRVTAVAETLAKTNLAQWQAGDRVNLERSLRVGDRLDGHFVQGQVDATAMCIEKQTMAGSWLFRFRFPKAFAALVIEKGSVCVQGVSLTAFDVGNDEFTVTIIPYTFAHTNFSQIGADSTVNIEFDVLGKYLLRQETISA
jgi:riboflavin synthase